MSTGSTRTALITGCSGYVGRHVARCFLDKGWQVLALVRVSSEIPADLATSVERIPYDGSLASLAALFATRPIDVVVHLASAVLVNYRPDQLDEIIDANVRLPTQLLEAMRQGTTRCFINTGTFSQHYQSTGYRPTNLYAASKQACEDMAQAFVVNDGVRFWTLVLFDNFGSDDKRGKIVNLMIDAIDVETPLMLSPGEQIIDLSHVDDIARAFEHAAQAIIEPGAPVSERYLVSGTRLKVRDLLDLVSRLAGRRVNARLGGRPYREREIMEPIGAPLVSLPGWQPMRPLEQEVLRLLATRGLSAPTDAAAGGATHG